MGRQPYLHDLPAGKVLQCSVHSLPVLTKPLLLNLISKLMQLSARLNPYFVIYTLFEANLFFQMTSFKNRGLFGGHTDTEVTVTQRKIKTTLGHVAHFYLDHLYFSFLIFLLLCSMHCDLSILDVFGTINLKHYMWVITNNIGFHTTAGTAL